MFIFKNISNFFGIIHYYSSTRTFIYFNLRSSKDIKQTLHTSLEIPISMSNLNELIQKLKFSQPFNIAKANQDVWITQTRQTNSGKELEAVVTEPLSIIFLPIALVGQIPLLLLSVGN